MRYFLSLFLILAVFAADGLAADSFPLDFTVMRLGEGPNAVLVVGGIQGDEPGGFSAATLLATRYEIHKGAVIVVPNLNFPSIIKRSRGLHGDMNRKFAFLDETDPEFATVRRIQEIIRQDNVGLVLNLHDGSGYYRPEYQDKLHCPARWGQSIIIDQENLDPDVFLGALGQEASAVAAKVNGQLLDPEHALHVHNTNTAAGDHEMEKSLSYYAARHAKAAFGLEASKEFNVELRAYYHLKMIEEFLRLAGVEFKRDFELAPNGVAKALRQNLGVTFAGNRVFLPLENARSTVNYLPLPRDAAAQAITSKPIMAVLPCAGRENELCVHYGNRIITLIKPDWHETDDSIDSVAISVDGLEKNAAFGQIIDVSNSIQVKKQPGLRVNAIGFDKGLSDESGIALKRKDFKDYYSLDRGGSIFRFEIYKGKKFSGMFLARFASKKSNQTLADKQEPKKRSRSR